MLALAACIHTPRIYGREGAPAAPSVRWPVPVATERGVAVSATIRAPADTLPAELSLADIVDLALRNSPATQLSWAQAHAAVNAYGAAQGRWYPSLTADANVTRTRSLATPGRPAGERTQYGPALSLSYLVFDFGGRSGSIDVARQTAIAADLAHNTAVENTILQAEIAAFAYMATRSQRDAQQASLNEAKGALQAAQERHNVGLATIADVLQARTALSQAQLGLESLEGSLQIARGTLAVAMGLPANATFDVPDVAPADSVHVVSASVDSLIEIAGRVRPELAAARVEAVGAASQVRVARSAFLPSFAVTGTGGRNASTVSTFAGPTYTFNIGVQVPLFTGFSREYDLRVANDELLAAEARAKLTKQQVIQQVFNAYYGLRTATNRVHTAADLLASATQSETVARGRYREGVGSIVDLLIAQSALASARAQEIDARWQWRAALAQLAHDVGVLDIRGEPNLPGVVRRDGGAGR